MIFRKTLPALAAVLAAVSTTAAVAQDAEAQLAASRMRGHVEFLASDLMEGREAGTRGYDLAASYVASQFLALGLKPAGDPGSYLQNVPLLGYRLADKGSMTVTRPGQAAVELPFGESFLPWSMAVAGETKVEGPLVFAGYGVVDEARKRNDYAGLNVKGKIVIVLHGAPASFQTEERAHYSGIRTKRMIAAQQGAVGLIVVNTPSREKARPFAEGAKHWDELGVSWRTPEGQPFNVAPNTPALGLISLEGAETLFAGARTPLAEVLKAAETREGRVRGFNLPGVASVRLNNAVSEVKSANVAGMLEGSDPALKNEVVVLSAHLDHVGLTPEGTPDRVNNGALDNAVGIATLLEVARAFQSSGERPRRSVLFLAVTAEEKGLVGAEYFARNPTVPKSALVANVNLDMPVLTYAFTDVTAFGAERSSLGPLVAQAAQRVGVKLSPDPLPEEGIFTRSDHYRFVEQGVPSVMLMTGFEGPGRESFMNFLRNRYHKPNDDLNQAIDWSAGAKFARLNYEIAKEIAGADQRPTWNKGDFFGVQFGGGGMKPSS